MAEVLRERGRRLVAHPELDLLAPEETWSETRYELGRQVELIAHHGHLEERAARELLEAALEVVEASVRMVSSEVYRERMEEVRLRVPRDPRDVPLVALALVLGCGIWTQDRDLFGCGLPVWTSETLEGHLEARADR